MAQAFTGHQAASEAQDRKGSGGALHFVRLILSAFAAFWRYLGSLDDALWVGFKRTVVFTRRAVASAFRGAWRALADLFHWFPGRAGRAYCAFAGMALLVSGLWVADELRASAATDGEMAAGVPGFPVDAKDPIVARIGGDYIRLSSVVASAVASGQVEVAETLTPAAAFSRGLVDAFVEQRLLADAARAAGLHRNPSVATRLEAARDRILAADYLNRRVEATVTDDAVERLYRANADVTRLGDEVRARHIVLASAEDAVAVIDALSGGADFGELAKARSVDAWTGALGGDLGYFTKDMMTPALARAAFATKTGRTAPIFRTEYGWHVLEVTGRRRSNGVSLGSVDDNIERFLTLRTIEKTVSELIEKDQVAFYRPEATTETSKGETPAAPTDETFEYPNATN
ncbi:MAG: peptidylprolyl isomerase [Pseudomonadota bacterium]